jgi:vancomycin aglycone glucosyltransferase
MRIALAPEGTRGDVHPMLALGAWLRERGHEVRACTSPDFADAVRAHGLEHRCVGGSVREVLRSQARAIARGGRHMLAAGDRYMRENIGAQFRELSDALAGCEHVIGAGVQLGAHSVAEKLGVPYRYVAYCPQLLRSGEHPPFTVEHHGHPPWWNRSLWWLTVCFFRFSLGGLLNRERRKLGLPPERDVYLHMLTRRPILAADPPLAEVPGDARVPVDRIPCLHPFRPASLPGKLEGFLAAGPPPVYVGFGSMTDPHPAETTRCVLDAVRLAGCRAVVSRGWAGLGEGPLDPGVLVIDGVDHAALFPRVAAVVHHGGAGTTTTAARAGVPQIVVPHVLDQHYWARRLHLLGVAPPPLPRRRLAPRALADAIEAVLGAELPALRARDLADRLERARPPLASLERVLEPLRTP